MSRPRLAPLAPDELDPYARQVFDGVGAGGAANMVATMAHHRRLFERFLAVTVELHSGELPSRLRELVVLRVAARRQCRYVWEQHARLARRAGHDDDALATLGAPVGPPWAGPERTVLAAVDQLLRHSTVDAPTWDALASTFSPAQLVELCLLVGHYSGLCFLANAAGVLPDEGGVPTPPLPGSDGG